MFGTLLRNAHSLLPTSRVTVLSCAFGSRGKSFRTPSHKKRNANQRQSLSGGRGDFSNSEVPLSSNPRTAGRGYFDSEEATENQESSDAESDDEILSEDEQTDQEDLPDLAGGSAFRDPCFVDSNDNRSIEPYAYDKDGAPLRPTFTQKDRVEPQPPIAYEKENPKIGQLVQLYSSMFGNPLDFDLLYLENRMRQGVDSIDENKNVTVKEITTKIDMVALLDRLLQNDTEKVTAFLCYRKQFVTELELHYCIPILARDSKFLDEIEKHPDLIALVTEQLSKAELGSAESAAVLFKEVSTLYGYTTPAEVLVNFLRQFTNHINSHLFFSDSVPTFVAPIEDLIKQGYKPKPEQLATLVTFYTDFMQHLVNPHLRKSNNLTMSAELEGFVHHMFYTVKLCSVEQALRLLEVFYRTVISSSSTRRNVTLDNTEDEGDFVLLDNDRVTNLPIIEALDVFLSEHILQLTLTQTARVLFIFVRSGRFDCVFGKVINTKLQQLEKERLAVVKNIAKNADGLRKLKELPGESAGEYETTSQEIVLQELTQQLKKTGTHEFAVVFQLIWSLSHVKQILPEIEASIWLQLEAMLIRSLNPSLLVVPAPQIGILISSFFNKGCGSDALWSQFMTYIKVHPKLLSVSLRCLVFHSLLTRGLLRSSTHASNFKVFVHQIQNFGQMLWDLADTLSRDEADTAASERLKIVMNLIMFSHLSGIENGFTAFELANRVRDLLKKAIVRKLVGDEPILMVAVTKIVHETLKAEFQILIKRHDHNSTEIALRQEDLHGWTSFARVLYYLDRKLENFTMICPLMVYIYLGRSYLDLAPLAAQLSKSDQEPLLDDLTVKRRVLHHQVQEMCKGLDPWTSLMALEVCLVEDYMDDKLLQHLVFKLSGALDNYTLDQVVTVGLGLKYFGLSEDHSFFELFPAVIELLASELPEESLSGYSIIGSILKKEFPSLSFPERLPNTDVTTKPGSLLHSVQAQDLINKIPEAHKHIMDYYWIFVAESGAGAVNLAVERVVHPPEQELKQLLSDSSPLQFALST